MEVQKIEGIIYKFYLETTKEQYDNGEPGFCLVIAADLEEGLAKVRAVWPQKKVNSVFTERDYQGDRGKALEIILL